MSRQTLAEVIEPFHGRILDGQAFAVALDGTNLTNTRRATYFGIDSRPRDVVVNDRRISLTARITY